MKRTRFARILFTLIATLILTGVVSAEPLGVKWTRRADVAGVGAQIFPVARNLVDGRFMVVVQDNGRPVALTYDVEGALHSHHVLPGVTMSPARMIVAIGPFGEVYAATPGMVEERITKSDGTSGTVLWSRSLPEGVEPRFVTPGADGDVVVTAFLYPQRRVVFLHYDVDGNLFWGPIDAFPGEPWASVRDRHGDVVTLSRELTPDVNRTWVTKVSGATGATIWGPREVELSICLEQEALVLDRAGNPIVTGCQYGVPTSAVTYKLDATTGEPIWSRRSFHGSTQVQPSALAVSPDGGVVLGAWSTDGSSILWKLDGHSGHPVWKNSLPSSGGRTAGIAFDGAGSLYVTSSEGVATGDILTRKIDGRDGSTVWGPVRFGDELLFETPIAYAVAAPILIDRAGGIVVTGLAASGPGAYARDYVENATADPDFVMHRYDRSSGGELWAQPRRFAGLTMVQDIGITEVVTDARGDLVLSLQDSFLSFGKTWRWAAAKFRSADGSTVWAAQEPDPDFSFRFPRVRLDPAGDLIAVGKLIEPASPLPQNYAIAKYDGATGALVWGPTVLGSAYDGSSIFSRFGTLPGGDVITSVDSAPHDLFRIDGQTGGVVWSTSIGGLADDVRIGSAGEIYAIHSFARTLSRIDPSNGGRLWTSPAPSWPRILDLDSAGHPIVASHGAPMTVAVFDPGSGQNIWTRSMEYSETNVYPERILIGSDDSVSVVAFISIYPNSVRKVFAARVSSSGQKLWERVYETESSYETLGAALLRADGSVATAGVIRQDGIVKLHLRTIDPASGDSDAHVLELSPPAWIARGLTEQDGDLVVVASGDGSVELIRLSEDFLIDARSTSEALAAKLGVPFEHQFFAAGGSTPYSWSSVSTVSVRTLPAGLTIDSATGRLSGTPLEEGEFHFNLQARDGQGSVVEAPVSLRVFPTRTFQLPAQPLTTCPGESLTLFAGQHETYRWFPTGEWTPTIEVRPAWRLPYGVHVTEADGTTALGAVEVEVFPSCHSVSSIEPASGPAAGGFSVLIRGTAFDAAAAVRIGGIESPVVGQQSAEIEAIAPALPPGTLHDVAVTMGGRTALLSRAFFAQFTDVPSSHPFASFIEAAIREGMTAGCGGGRFCIDDPVLRAHAAVFLVRAKYGSTYEPPAPASQRFLDVPPGSFGAAFIDKLASEGISSGCGGGLFCPAAPVSRAQAAVLILKAKHGRSHWPPPATGMFLDVDPADPFAPWIEELARAGITSGCGGGNFCPNAPITRGQMMVMLARAFGWS